MNQPYLTVADYWAMRLKAQRHRERIAKWALIGLIPAALGLVTHLVW